MITNQYTRLHCAQFGAESSETDGTRVISRTEDQSLDSLLFRCFLLHLPMGA